MLVNQNSYRTWSVVRIVTYLRWYWREGHGRCPLVRTFWETPRLLTHTWFFNHVLVAGPTSIPCARIRTHKKQRIYFLEFPCFSRNFTIDVLRVESHYYTKRGGNIPPFRIDSDQTPEYRKTTNTEFSVGDAFKDPHRGEAKRSLSSELLEPLWSTVKLSYNSDLPDQESEISIHTSVFLK